MERAEKNKMKCSLCGAEFDPEANTCGGCALRKDCTLTCCPNCGLEVPKESRLVSWIRKQGEKRRERNGGTQ